MPTGAVLLENSEFYDLSGKNGNSSGFCQVLTNCCRNHQMKPVNMERVRTGFHPDVVCLIF